MRCAAWSEAPSTACQIHVLAQLCSARFPHTAACRLHTAACCPSPLGQEEAGGGTHTRAAWGGGGAAPAGGLAGLGLLVVCSACSFRLSSCGAGSSWPRVSSMQQGKLMPGQARPPALRHAGRCSMVPAAACCCSLVAVAEHAIQPQHTRQASRQQAGRQGPCVRATCSGCARGCLSRWLLTCVCGLLRCPRWCK